MTSLNPEAIKNFKDERNVLSISGPTYKKEIQQGMSPKEIAEIVSDHLIEIVKKQFEIAKNAYHPKY